MKNQDIRSYSDTELASALQEQQQLLAELKYQHKLAGVENPARLTSIRRDIARLLTHQRQRQLAANETTNA